MVAKKVLCKGRVQGVFYRASTRSKAQSRDIKGWVKNQSDGSVLIHAEGPESKINELVRWCNKGPSNARVTSIEVSDAVVIGYESFEIIR